MRKIKWAKFSTAKSLQQKLRFIIGKPLFFFVPYFPIVRKLASLHKNVSPDNKIYVCEILFGSEKTVMFREDFDSIIDAEFEGMTLKIPACYDKWLTKIYGNYMEFPPEEERIPHHHVKTYWR